MSQQPKQIHFEDFAHNPETLFKAIAATYGAFARGER